MGEAKIEHAVQCAWKSIEWEVGEKAREMNWFQGSNNLNHWIIYMEPWEWWRFSSFCDSNSVFWLCWNAYFRWAIVQEKWWKNVQCRENWKDRLSLAAVSSLYTWDIGNTLRTNLLIWIFKNLDVAYSHKVEKPFFYKVWSGPGWTHSHIFYWRKGYGEIMFSIMAHNWRRQSLAGYFSKFCQFRSQLRVPKLKTWSRQIMFYVI